VKVLAPILHKDAYTLAVERHVRDHFWEVLFFPLVDLIAGAGVEIDARENAFGFKSAVVRALESGKLWYADGEFSGQFNAEISRELRAMGATLSKTRGTFELPVDKIPFDVRGAAAASVDRSRALHQSLQDTLATIEANALGLATRINVGDAVTEIVRDLVHQFNESVEAIDVVEVSAEMTPEIAAALETDLTLNLDLYVKNFLSTEIVELRQLVAANAFAGYRTDKLADMIEARWGVTKRKAAFLADQETGLLVAKFREQRYRAIGSRRYKWSTSHDDLVRHDHRLLNGEIFFWDSKPVTNRKTGARNNPGEDFRCRCVAMPIIDELGDTGAYENSRNIFATRRLVGQQSFR
jgi:SPP1 gp7 family putative phage head morphogenesis protein